MNFYYSFLLYLFILVLINSKNDKTIKLTLELNEENLFPLLPITIGELETKIMYISTYQNISTNIVIFLNQYNISKAKNEKKNDSYLFNNELIIGKVYSDSFIIDTIKKEMKFIYNNTLSNNMTGLIHFSPNNLLNFFKKNISFYTISFSEFDIHKNLNIILGEKYYLTNFTYFDICDMENKDNLFFGCKLKNIIIKDKKLSKNIFTVFEFSNISNRNYIECNRSMILNITNFLNQNKFKCESNKCESNNITGYLNFGYRNIYFKQLHFKEKNIDYIIFHGNVINNLKIIYDFHNDKIVLYSDKQIITINPTIPDPWKRNSYWWVFGLILFGILLIAYIILRLLNTKVDDLFNSNRNESMAQLLP